METLMSQLEPISTNGKTKNFITGHSYGAAVANLLVAELIDRGVLKAAYMPILCNPQCYDSKCILAKSKW